jgi:transcriptional regulator with XRE-family HTH domain
VTDEAIRRRQALGRALRAAREAAEMTQQQAAAALGCKQPKINKIESTQVAITEKDLGMLLVIYRVSDVEGTRIRRLRAAAAPGASASSASNNAYLQMLELEPEADEILSLHGEGMPSLLQSQHYKLTQYQCAGNPLDHTILIASHEERMAIFRPGSRLRRYRMVLSESSLRRMPGGHNPGLVIDQAQHLLRMSEEFAQLSIRVATFAARIPYFPSDFVYLESGAGHGQKFAGATTVAAQEDCWRMVHEAALSVDDTRKYLNNLVTDARTWEG